MDAVNPKSGFSVSTFVQESHVRNTWIAFFTLWVLWGLVYFVRHIFAEDTADKPAPAEQSSQDPEAAATKKKLKWKPQGGFGGRIVNAHRVLFENTLLLLSVLVLNTFGTGSTRAVMILTWMYVFDQKALLAYTVFIYSSWCLSI